MRVRDLGGKQSAAVQPVLLAAPWRFGAPGPWLAPALAGLLLTAGCATLTAPTAPTGPAALPELKSERAPGFLPTSALPNSLKLLPPPPAAGSAAFAADQAAFRETRAYRDTPRWALAASDAILSFPQAPEAFSCALDAPITAAATPHLYTLLARSESDAGASTGAAKNHYQRTRPFVVYNQSSCKPSDEAHLRTNGSYPSGHTTIGWTWTLILTELAPERTDPLLSRGYAFGQSRVICGVHWQSDVTAGRVLAAGVVARLHADPAFRTQVEAARAELAAVRAKGLKPTRDCQAEAAALALPLPSTRHR
ncbi:phosphatase PAP2 family protein [uncultured Thiodictyon sp.]|uniref:acid phosphatase n=1 Tax=uncultured Thiodictyon sp. TaxID=1846217 RepID=UPI0025F9456D|nr:phosphatase PAP2 family protein [uncultured Thiodictyon sp.]